MALRILTEEDKKQLEQKIESAILVGGENAFAWDDTLELSEDGELSVVTTETVEEGNIRPITSGAVHTILGDIESLLKQI